MTEDALEKIKGNFIGIVVLLLAFVIVNVIIQSLTGTTTPNATPISEGL
jgi:hypothetical protein